METVVNGEKASVRVKYPCRTRWMYRHEAYENFGTLFTYLVTVMTAINSGDDTHGRIDWDSDTVVKANGLLKMYTTFQFIVVFVVTMNAMAIIKPVSVKLQKRLIDIVSAYNEVSSVISELESVRANDQMLHQWYTKAETTAATV